MPKKQFTTRLDIDDAEAVKEYQEERDLTQAEAVRRLVRKGVESVDDERARTMPDGGAVINRLNRQERNQKWRGASTLAGLMYVLAYFEGFRGAASIVVGVLIFVFVVVAAYGVSDAEVSLGGGRDD
jgi:hypothetical protein